MESNEQIVEEIYNAVMRGESEDKAILAALDKKDSLLKQQEGEIAALKKALSEIRKIANENFKPLEATHLIRTICDQAASIRKVSGV